jgi:hypothetical protein
MTTDTIRALLAARPFRGFTLRTASGQEFSVSHPEAMSVSPGGRTVYIWTTDNGGVTIDLLLVESVGDASKHRRPPRRKSA